MVLTSAGNIPVRLGLSEQQKPTYAFVLTSGGQVTLRSSDVTFLPLLVKETTATFNPLPIFPLQLIGTAILKVTKSLLVTTKSS